MRDTDLDEPRRTTDATEFDAYVMALIGVSYSTPGEFARHAGVAESILSKWASGQRRLSHDTLRKIAPFLGVTYGDLMVKAGLASPEEFPSRGPALVPRRYAKTLTKAQDFLDDPNIPDKAKKRLLIHLRFVVNDAFELHYGVPHEPSHDERRR